MSCKHMILHAVLAAVLAGGAAAGDLPAHSTAADRTRVDVTVYNHDLALVRELRDVTLPKGSFRFEFRDVPSRINPVTLLVSSEEGGGFRLFEQNYEFDLMSPNKILEKYVGREIGWIQDDGSRIQGRLLGTANGQVYLVDEEIMFQVPGRLVLPDLPANLRARPTLVWLAESSRAGVSSLETSYLTNGFSWHADYVLQLDGKGERAGLQAWVTVENRSGASFEDARLLLVAGDINQVRPTAARFREMEVMAARSPVADQFTEESLYDYHLYSMQRPATLLDNQIKQVSLFEADGIVVQRQYRLSGHNQYFRGMGRMSSEGKVDVSYKFENTKRNELGMPLPAGVFRVYGLSGSGARQLLGEDRIDHTPEKEPIELTVGKAFDLVAERVRSDSRKLANNLYRHSFAITLRNHKREDVTVEVVEPVGGFWEMVDSSLPHRKLDAGTLAFDVPVPSDGETVLTYTIDVRY